jgi:hypothetical protein
VVAMFYDILKLAFIHYMLILLTRVNKSEITGKNLFRYICPNWKSRAANGMMNGASQGTLNRIPKADNQRKTCLPAGRLNRIV